MYPTFKDVVDVLQRVYDEIKSNKKNTDDEGFKDAIHDIFLACHAIQRIITDGEKIVGKIEHFIEAENEELEWYQTQDKQYRLKFLGEVASQIRALEEVQDRIADLSRDIYAVTPKTSANLEALTDIKRGLLGMLYARAMEDLHSYTTQTIPDGLRIPIEDSPMIDDLKKLSYQRAFPVWRSGKVAHLPDAIHQPVLTVANLDKGKEMFKDYLKSANPRGNLQQLQEALDTLTEKISEEVTIQDLLKRSRRTGFTTRIRES